MICVFHCTLADNELYSSIQHFEHKAEKRENIQYFYLLSGWEAAVKLYDPFKKNYFYSEMLNADKDQKFC